ncbi:hypothetical protein [Ruegeria lacuscaerulensis]|uniref:hypothetical protein n=1 Tax=Ruegeria lacuscaerulensis TaxID=55218 RepID=UPI001F42DB1A|nr:hypothetical protein [Ruegeria lacuscaerulensis]
MDITAKTAPKVHDITDTKMPPTMCTTRPERGWARRMKTFSGSPAKDNNTSCAIGPMIRLFDDGFTLDEVRTTDLKLSVIGPGGFVLNGHFSTSQISRRPFDLVKQTIGRHHQYPDGLMLFLRTFLASTQDRDTPDGGFT